MAKKKPLNIFLEDLGAIKGKVEAGLGKLPKDATDAEEMHMATLAANDAFHKATATLSREKQKEEKAKGAIDSKKLLKLHRGEK